MRTPRLPMCSVLLSTLFLSAILTNTSQAQDVPEPPKPPIFRQLFAQPTGMNGYEDWVQAGDLIQNNKQIEQMLEEGATLTMKRRLLTDPQVQAALHLLHVGLSKPTSPPRSGVDADTRLPEYAPFRKLAHLLSVEMYVQFADGRIDAAIDTLDDGLRFGYRIQTDTILSGLSGIVVSTATIDSFSAHLDQLSDYQCLRVRRLVEEMGQWPSPATFVLRGEQQSLTRMLDRLQTDPTGVALVVGSFSDDEEDWGEDERLVATHLRSNPASLGILVEQAKIQLSAYYDAAFTNLKLPPKERNPLPPLGGDALGGRMLTFFAPSIEPFLSKYDRSEAMMRLLSVHAAIRAYRWEHNHLPQTLADLHLGSLALDPFTGDPLCYQNNDATYDLFSRGPASLDTYGKPTTAPTMPVRL